MLIKLLSAVSAVAAVGLCFLWGGFSGIGWLWMLPVIFLAAMLLQVLAGFIFLLILCGRVDQKVPQEEDDPLYRKVVDRYIEACLPVLQIHIKTSGMEKVPSSGRFLLVCNHTNDSDAIILLRCFVKHQLTFISKRENSTMFVIGPMMHKIQCQLINRENDREALKTILRCIRILEEDKASIAVFPEGGIDDDGLLHRFKPGVFKIAQRANVPIVVCSLKNTKDVIHNLLRLKPSYVEMNVLEVISPEDVRGATTVELAHRCHDLMAEDLGPELVGD